MPPPPVERRTGDRRKASTGVTPRRFMIWTVLILTASVGSSILATNRAQGTGTSAGKAAGKAEIQREVQGYAYSFAKSQAKASRKSCRAGNNFRIEVNHRTAALRGVAGVVDGFLLSARATRLTSAQNGNEAAATNDREAARMYGLLTKQLAAVHFTEIPLRPCSKLFPDPPLP